MNKYTYVTVHFGQNEILLEREINQLNISCVIGRL